MSYPSENKTIKGLAFHHISITTKKMDETLHFYRDLLGMPIEKEMLIGERRLFQLNIGDGLLVEISDPTPENRDAASTPIPLNHIGFVTDNLIETVEKVRSAGYPVTVEPRPMSGSGSMSFVKGPNGESIEFMQLD
jgi:catechol 2,3-dioxygenase-like lactoylglutathione lyase family enzyme